MQINVTCRHMDPTDTIRQFAQEKIESQLADFPRVQTVHVIMDVEKYRHIAEVVVHAKNHIHIEAKEVSDDMYVSIDKAVEKVAKQLRRLRDKVTDHKTRGKTGQADLDRIESEPPKPS